MLEAGNLRHVLCFLRRIPLRIRRRKEKVGDSRREAQHRLHNYAPMECSDHSKRRSCAARVAEKCSKRPPTSARLAGICFMCAAWGLLTPQASQDNKSTRPTVFCVKWHGKWQGKRIGQSIPRPGPEGCWGIHPLTLVRLFVCSIHLSLM